MKFRKKPVVIEASRWHKMGDHPNVQAWDPYQENVTNCFVCHIEMRFHGLIRTLEGFHIVCPGDWIITGVAGEQYPCKPDTFEATYERVK